MNQQQPSAQQELEQRVQCLYNLYINHNPTLKNYIITVGLLAKLRTEQELEDFWRRILAPPSELDAYVRVMAEVIFPTLSSN